MYYIFPFHLMGNEKENYALDGTLYNSANEEMSDFIFNEGLTLDKDELKAPFTMILDESISRIKRRTLQDRVASGGTNMGELLLLSPKAQAFFEAEEIPLQFFDVHIKGSDFELKDYKLANITDMFECLDYENSDVEYSEVRAGEILYIDEIAVDESKVPPNKLLFILDAKGQEYTIIHESLKDKIEASDLTGFYFQDLEFEYTVEP